MGGLNADACHFYIHLYSCTYRKRKTTKDVRNVTRKVAKLTIAEHAESEIRLVIWMVLNERIAWIRLFCGDCTTKRELPPFFEKKKHHKPGTVLHLLSFHVVLILPDFDTGEPMRVCDGCRFK